MRERAESGLKLLCGVLVACLIFQLVRAIMRNNPFAHVTIPAVPVLATSETNAPAGAAHNGPPGTNVPPAGGTNLVRGGTNQMGTNLVINAHSTNRVAGTNTMVVLAATNGPSTGSESNLAVVAVATNHAPVAATNVVVVSPSTNPATVAAPTNVAVAVVSTNGTNLAAASLEKLGTNAVIAGGTNYAGTNGMGTNGLAAGKKKSAKGHRPPGMAGGMPGGFPGMPGMGGPLPELPPLVKARIDQIVSSELLGPVIHPQPMGLMGIAGDEAFLRTDSGQTGIVKLGDSLGDLKLVKIGINRVLVEQNGEKKELTIFDGLGGESLLAAPDTNSNETKHP